MRFSAIAALCTAPLALAGVLEADVVPRGLLRRGGHPGGVEKSIKQAQAVNVVGGSATTIIVIWVNTGAGAPTQTMNPTQVAPAATHTVTVGGPGGLVYSPEQTKAAVGDLVIFEFWSQNHTVSQSPFDTPCKAIEGGLDSGFMANPNNTISPPPQMAMQVTTDKPLWFYCKQNGHCGKGMVFSINPTAEKTHAMFKEKAIADNGKGTLPPIVGGPPAAAPPAPPAAAPSGAPPSNVVAPPPAQTQPGNGMATGIGQINNGQCTCSCLCGVASFPQPALQGRGAWGGMSGAMPMAALEK